MASRARPPEARRPAARRRAWLFAITAWTGFLGAVLGQAAVLILLHDALPESLGWTELSLAFLCDWLIVMTAIALALMLALPLAGVRDGR